MSGCFDGAVGDAEGTDDESPSGTTVINNYHNNTTILQNGNTDYQSISFSLDRVNDSWGVEDEIILSPSYSYGLLEIGTFNTSSNTVVEVISASALYLDNQSWSAFSYVFLTSDCDGVTQNHSIRTDNYLLPSTVEVIPLRGTLSSDCVFSVSILWYGNYDDHDTVFSDSSDRIIVELGFQVFSATPVTTL